MVPAKQRVLVDMAAEVLASEAQRLGITYSGFCLTGFPHKRLADSITWEKRGHRVTLLVEPGRLMIEGRSQLYGVPFGARARMILIYLQSQALRTRSREVSLGRSMRDWLSRMNVPPGGETARAFREQAARISACSIKFFWDHEGGDGFEKGAIIRSGLFFGTKSNAEGRQGMLWEDVVVLDEAFYRALQDHPVPLLESAIRQLKDRSLSLDIYVWLAYRLHSLVRTTSISWLSLHGQFGAGFKHLRQFKGYFIDALAAALAAYPDADVDITDDSVVLHPSRPPIARIK